MKGSAEPLSLGGFPQVLEDSRTVLIAADVLPDGPFPQDEKLKDGMVFPVLLFPPSHHLDLLSLLLSSFSPHSFSLWKYPLMKPSKWSPWVYGHLIHISLGISRLQSQFLGP